MVSTNESTCPKCGGELTHYDSVKRIVRTKGRVSEHIKIRRLKCRSCGIIHRELPESVVPYKQYEADMIEGVLEGFITSDTLGFEEYPCELTMANWRAEKNIIPPTSF